MIHIRDQIECDDRHIGMTWPSFATQGMDFVFADGARRYGIQRALKTTARAGNAHGIGPKIGVGLRKT